MKKVTTEEATNASENTAESAEKRFSVPEGMLNSLLQYLQKKPFEEAAPLINGLQQTARIIE